MRNFLRAFVYCLFIFCLSPVSAEPPEDKDASIEEVYELSLRSLKEKTQQIEQRNSWLLSAHELFLKNIQSLHEELQFLKKQKAHLTEGGASGSSYSEKLKPEDIQGALINVRQDVTQLENKIRSLDNELQQLNKQHRHQLSGLEETLMTKEKRNADLKEEFLSLEKAFKPGEAD